MKHLTMTLVLIALLFAVGCTTTTRIHTKTIRTTAAEPVLE